MQKISHLILAITALGLSRATFALFDDPEGPNLLIVVVFAAVLYFLSRASYSFKSIKLTGFKRLLLTILIQVIIGAIFYLCFK